ncbi:hypothetical protein [Brevundimonas sp.]|uniref:hypothetical protein n=1 Tax=Brevundimonas sp. TaxID=1871086 RepID=UPI001E175884|nr:hypothetical protein [Brevundimonas sp.]MBA4000568.1 hypothetical protein [Brevundimonas sp.]
MSQATFKLVYDGDALKEGEMDVADLAPALLAMGEFVRASAHAVYGDEARVSVKVRATNEGSFEVLFAMAVDAASHAWEFWKKDDVQAAAQLASLMGLSGVGVGGGAIWAIRKLRGQPAILKSASEPGSVEIETPTGLIVVPEGVGRIVVDRAVRLALERLVADPLEKEGIDTVIFAQGERAEKIQEFEASWFRTPLTIEADEFISRYTRAFSIMSLHFTAGKKWRLSDGRGPAKLIAIDDEDFNGKVARNEVRFAKGDILICEVVETSRRTDAGFKSEFEIIRVIEHRPAPASPPQLPLAGSSES